MKIVRWNTTIICLLLAAGYCATVDAAGGPSRGHGRGQGRHARSPEQQQRRAEKNKLRQELDALFAARPLNTAKIQEKIDAMKALDAGRETRRHGHGPRHGQGRGHRHAHGERVRRLQADDYQKKLNEAIRATPAARPAAPAVPAAVPVPAAPQAPRAIPAAPSLPQPETPQLQAVRNGDLAAVRALRPEEIDQRLVDAARQALAKAKTVFENNQKNYGDTIRMLSNP